MAVESDPDVLDLLFDKSAGILKSELPDIQTLDFVSNHYLLNCHILLTNQELFSSKNMYNLYIVVVIGD